MKSRISNQIMLLLALMVTSIGYGQTSNISNSHYQAAKAVAELEYGQDRMDRSVSFLLAEKSKSIDMTEEEKSIYSIWLLEVFSGNVGYKPNS